MKASCVESRDLTQPTLDMLKNIGAELGRSDHKILIGSAKWAKQAFANGGNSVAPADVFLYTIKLF